MQIFVSIKILIIYSNAEFSNNHPKVINLLPIKEKNHFKFAQYHFTASLNPSFML